MHRPPASFALAAAEHDGMYVMHNLRALWEVLGVSGVSRFSVKGARDARLAIVVVMVVAVVVVAILLVFVARVMLFTDILDSM